MLPKVVDTNFTSETNQSSVDANKIIVTTIEEPTTGTDFSD